MKEEENEVFVEEEQDGEDFDGALHAIYQRFCETRELTSEDREALLALFKKPKQHMDIASYVCMMYMIGMSYEQKDNRNASRYCAMRLLRVKESIEKPRRKRPRYLVMQPYTFEEDTVDFIQKYTEFLEEKYQKIRVRLRITSTVLLILVFVILVLFRITMFLAAIEAVIVSVLNYLIQTRKLPEMFQKNQIIVIEKYVDEDVIAFDRLYRL